jgi:hypothetical protein
MSHGLVAGSTQYPTSKFARGPVSLFHKDKPPVMVSNVEDEAKYLAEGYSVDYVEPKEVFKPITKPAEEKKL